MTLRSTMLSAFTAVTLLAGSALAEPPMKDGGKAFRAACSPDIEKFCASVARGKPLHLCVRSHHAELSASCRAFLYDREAPDQGAPPAPPPQQAPPPPPPPQ